MKTDIQTHCYLREDVRHGPFYDYVPTDENTKWVGTWEEFKAAGGVLHFNGDQTEIVLTLPVGFKFSIRFQDSQTT